MPLASRGVSAEAKQVPCEDLAGARHSTGDLLSLPGMNPERVQTLTSSLSVRNRADLKRAIAAGRLVGLRGFSRELKARLEAGADGRAGSSLTDIRPRSRIH
jgi:DNA polymerase/3'-5' exonuclease PolX